jgi:hypothetical protein
VKGGRRYIKVPVMWQEVLAGIRADGTTYRVALYLLGKAAWSENIPLGNRVLEKLGVSRRGKWRALERLRQVGLVAVERRRGRPPMVRVRFTR